MKKNFTLIALCYLGLANAQVPTNGLVAEWLFTDGSIMSSDNQLNAIVPPNNNVTNVPDRFGNPDNAKQVVPVGGWISFQDRFDDITSGPNAEFTYSFWIKLNEFNNAYKCLFAKATFESTCGYAGRQYAVLVTPSGKLEFQIFGALTGGHRRISGNTTLTVGEWHHVVVSLDMATLLPTGSGLKMYVDGVLQGNIFGENANPGISINGMSDGNAPLGFGTYLNGSGITTASCANSQDLNGQLDDFRVYDRVITAQEVSDLFNEIFTPCDPAVITQQPQSLAACSGTVQLFCSAQSGTVSQMQWEWYSGGNWLGSSTTTGTVAVVNVSETNNGMWRVKLTSDCGTISYSDTVYVAIGEPIIADQTTGIGGNNAIGSYICSGSAAPLFVDAVGENVTYQWTQQQSGQPFNVQVPINGATDATYNATQTGFYRVEVTACGQTVISDYIRVEAATAPTITIFGPTTRCSGADLSLTSTYGGAGNPTYEWSTGATTFNLTDNPTQNTTYTLTVTSPQGCTATDDHTVTVLPLPEPVIVENNGVLEASGGPFDSHQWFLNGNSLGVVVGTYTPTQDGVYTVSVTSGPCSNTSDPYNYTGLATGINVAEANALQVYPNPFEDIVMVEFDGTTQVRLMNTLGEMVLSQTINGRATLDVSSLPSGIYFLQHETSGDVMKLVKN